MHKNTEYLRPICLKLRS